MHGLRLTSSVAGSSLITAATEHPAVEKRRDFDAPLADLRLLVLLPLLLLWPQAGVQMSESRR
jgi:hypothetical protein